MKKIVHFFLSVCMLWADWRFYGAVAITGEPPEPDFVDKIMDKLAEYA